jgi:nucleotide-binding universal stress UspA family protein
MYKHILIATDGSQLAEKAVSAGLTLAKGVGINIALQDIDVSDPGRPRGHVGHRTFFFIRERKKTGVLKMCARDVRLEKIGR